MGKLYDCVVKNPSECELFVVQSTTLGELARESRDRVKQAVVVINDPMLVTKDSDLLDVLDDEELQTLISSLGVGVQIDDAPEGLFNLLHLRYHKILLMVEAGPTGQQARKNLIAFMYLYMLPVLKAGHVYLFDEDGQEDLSATGFEAQFMTASSRSIKRIQAAATLEETLTQI